MSMGKVSEVCSECLGKHEFLPQVTSFPPRPGVKIPVSTSHKPGATAASMGPKGSVGAVKDRLQTLSQRYWEMKASESKRVAIGDSFV